MGSLKYDTFPDEALIKMIYDEGRKELYEVIYNRYFKKVRDKCHSFLKNKLQAEEFANDILAKAYEKLPGFRGQSAFASWLYTITYNYLIDYLRKKKQLHYPRWNEENQLPEIIDESNTDVEELSYDKVIGIFEKIHPEEKALLLMKYQEGLPLKTIAKILVITEDAVKMRLKRARARVIYLYNKQE